MLWFVFADFDIEHCWSISSKRFCRFFTISTEIKELCIVLGNGDEDFGNSYDDCDARNEKTLVDTSVLLKKVSSVFIPFVSCSNSFFLFLFLHIVVLESLVYAALMLFTAFLFQWRASVISLFPTFYFFKFF